MHVGSASTFGYGSRQRPGDEQSPYRGRHCCLGHLNYKRAAHQVAARHATRGAPVVMVAPTFIFGALDTHYGSSQLLIQFARAAVVPCPPGGKNFVFVEDVAAAICNALTSGEPGESYILGHRNPTYRRLVELIAEVIGRPRVTVALPPALVRTAGAVGSAYGVVTQRPPALNSAMARVATGGHYYSP